eukprot:792594-Prorocentrum_minimum.AAC.1
MCVNSPPGCVNSLLMCVNSPPGCVNSHVRTGVCAPSANRVLALWKMHALSCSANNGHPANV